MTSLNEKYIKYSLNDKISLDYFYNQDKKEIKRIDSHKIDLHKIDLYKIYKNKNVFMNLERLKHRDLVKYFPLLSLSNESYDKWRTFNYDYSNNNPIENIIIKDFIEIQYSITKYIINKWKKLTLNNQILYMLTLFDFYYKTLNINKNDTKFYQVLKDKMLELKNTILNTGIINEETYDNIYNKF
jgi:hypothetical protein